MCVTAEIFNDGRGGFERRLAVDDPIFLETDIEQVQKMFGIMQIALFPEKLKFLRVQEMEELAPEFTGESPYGDEELFAGVGPRANFGQSTRRDNAVYVRVVR